MFIFDQLWLIIFFFNATWIWSVSKNTFPNSRFPVTFSFEFCISVCDVLWVDSVQRGQWLGLLSLRLFSFPLCLFHLFKHRLFKHLFFFFFPLKNLSLLLCLRSDFPSESCLCLLSRHLHLPVLFVNWYPPASAVTKPFLGMLYLLACVFFTECIYYNFKAKTSASLLFLLCFLLYKQWHGLSVCPPHHCELTALSFWVSLFSLIFGKFLMTGTCLHPLLGLSLNVSYLEKPLLVDICMRSVLSLTLILYGSIPWWFSHFGSIYSMYCMTFWAPGLCLVDHCILTLDCLRVGTELKLQ